MKIAYEKKMQTSYELNITKTISNTSKRNRRGTKIYKRHPVTLVYKTITKDCQPAKRDYIDHDPIFYINVYVLFFFFQVMDSQTIIFEK